MTIWSRLMRSLTAFREAYFSSDPEHVAQYETVEARRLRYSVFWAMYSNETYRTLVHKWSTRLKHQASLGRYIRSLYSPANRLGNFYAAHLLGGALSATAAQDGAIPIATESEELRAAIATLWKASNLAQQKDIITLRGAIEGDSILRVRDDVSKEVVQLERIDVSTVVELTKDSLGNVKGYVIEEERADPSNKARTVTYREVVTREGESCVYSTFLNNKPYSWAEDQPATWREPYGFTPLVHILHHATGAAWGWSELMPMRSLVQECDDIASFLGDQIARAVNPRWFVSGAKQGDLAVTGAQGDTTGAAGTRPDPGREELKLIFAPKDAKVDAMLADLDLSDALEHLSGLLAELERSYPELQHDLWATGATSGRALRIARSRVEAKVLQRRENYDAGLVKLFSMAVAIGGWRSYDGYSGFDLDSYAKGDLDHTIAPRPVFAADPMDAVEIDDALWTAAGKAVKAGASLEGFLKKAGWSDEEIAEITNQEGEIEDEEVL